jgi:hypothetical protein
VTRLLPSRINKLLTSAWVHSLSWGGALTLVFLWPVFKNFSTHLPSYDDGILIGYLIHWIGQALLTGQNLYNVPFFHPFSQTLAYSDPFLSTGLISIPLSWLTHNLVILSNTNLILGSVTCVMGMYVLVWELSRSKLASLLAALVFTFSSLHFHYLVHLHTYLVAGLPVSVYFFLKWLRTDQRKYLVGAATCFLLQALNAPMTAFFLGFIYLPISIQPDIRQLLAQRWRSLVLTFVIVGGVCAAFYYPYFQVSKAFNYTRSIREAAAFGHSLNFFWRTETALLIGLALMGWYGSRQVPSKSQSRTEVTLKPLTLVSVMLMGAVLMLGPVVKLNDQTFKILSLPIPLPYAVLYYLVPGFQAFRTSSRWVTVFNFGLSVLLGSWWGRINHHRGTQVILVGGLGVWLWLSQVPQLKLFVIPQTVDPIYTVVAQRPEKVLAELPVFSWNMTPFNSIEAERLLAQLHHGKTLYNGISGFTPPGREAAAGWLWQSFPQPETIEYFQSQGVELILVNYEVYDRARATGFTSEQQPAPESSTLRQALNQNPRLQLIECSLAACLYTIVK